MSSGPSDQAESQLIHHHLHWSSVLFDVLSHGRNLLLPAIFGVVGAARGDRYWLIFSAILFVPAVMISVFRYLTLTYCIQDGKLQIKHGLIYRLTRSVPLDRIQNVDFVQNPLHRLLAVAEVRVETAAGSEPEATLRVLALDQVHQLRAEIFPQRSQGALGSVAAAAEQAAVATLEVQQLSVEGTGVEGLPLLQIPVLQLVQAGLATNRGMLLVGVLLGGLFQNNWQQRFDFDFLENLLPERASTALTVVIVLLAILAFWIVLRMLGVAWYILRFYGYQLIRRGEDLQISCGLITKVQATIPRRRIQLISVQRNLVMRWLGLCSVRIETASGSGAHEDATKSVSGRWFIPVMADEQLPLVLCELRPGLYWRDEYLHFQSVSGRAVKRRTRFAISLWLMSALPVMIWSLQWGAVWALVQLPIWFAWAYLNVKSLGYVRLPEGVVFRSGYLTIKTSVTFFERIQGLELVRSPFDRRWKMATLSIDTAAAGPADHRIEVPLLDESWAESEWQAIQSLAASHQPVFR